MNGSTRLRLRLALAACAALLVALGGAAPAAAAGDPFAWSGAYPLSLRANNSTVACASTTQCTAVDIGGGETTYNPLVALTSPPALHLVEPNGAGNVLSITCPSTSQCTMVDGNGGELTFDPRSATPTGTRYVLNAQVAESGSVACPSVSQCTAVFGASEVTFNPQSSPATGTAHTIDNATVTSVACPSLTQCTALDAQGAEMTFDPTSSSPSPTAYQVVQLEAEAVACSTVSQCTAVDSNGTEATFNPTSPPTAVQSHTVSSGQGLFALACPSASRCTAVNGSGGEVTFDPSSSTPNSTATGVSGVALSGVACPSVDECAVVDNSGNGFTGRNPAAFSSPTLSLSAPASGAEGSPIAASSVAAVVSGGSSPSGTVTFSVFGPSATAPTSCGAGWAVVGTATVSGAGTYHPSGGFTPTTGVGNYWWYASYDGDTNNNPEHSTCGAGMAETVVRPGLSLSAPSLGTEGSPIAASSVSAALSQGTSPTGTITFRVFGPSTTAPTSCPSTWKLVGTATVSGNGTYHPSGGFTPVTGAGNYWWSASYSGDASNPDASSTCGAGMAETVVHPALSVSAPSSGTSGSAIAPSAVSAVLSGGSSPGGTITFSVFGPAASAPTSCGAGWQVVGTAAVSGNGTYHPAAGFTPSAGAGNYWWYASYDGGANNPDASSTCGAGMTKTTVATAQPSLSVSAPASGTSGSAISASSVSAALSGGFSPQGLITVWVFGPAAAAPASCSGWQEVGIADVSGNGTYHPSGGFTPVTGTGNYWWYASYNGDGNNSSASSTCGAGMTETTVAAATTSLSASAPSADTAGTAISASGVSAALSGGGSPGGTVTFTVFGPQSSAPSDCSSGGKAVGTATVSDNGTYHPSAGFTPSASGGYWWYASYGGDSGNNPSASACGASMPETTVARVSTSLSLTVPSVGAAGTAISSVAALSGGLAPGGTVTFKVFGPQASAPSDCSGGTTVGTASVSGSGNYRSAQFIPSAAGNYWWYASYGGDSNNNPSSSPCGASMAETVAGPGNGGGGNGTGGEGSAHLGAASVTGTTVTEPLSCSGSGSCAVTLTLSVTETISHGRVIAVTASHSSRRVIIARRSVHVAAGGHVRVRLPLNAKGRALLKHHSPLHALLGLSVGGRTGASTQVTIRRPRHRR